VTGVASRSAVSPGPLVVVSSATAAERYAGERPIRGIDALLPFWRPQERAFH
jgi:hypothetical protein